MTLFLKVHNGFMYDDTKAELFVHLNQNGQSQVAAQGFVRAGSPVEGLPFIRPDLSSSDVPTQYTLEVQEKDLPTSDAADESWWQRVTINGNPHSRLKPEAIEDIWIICGYAV
jgi:hypothetical protein